jgi:hypothetical protein
VDGDLVDMNEVVERKFAGDKVNIDFLRDRKKQTETITLKRFLPYVTLGNQYNQRPRYIVSAGLVFQPMDRNLMDANDMRNPLTSYFFDNYMTDKLYKERPEVVILTNVLPDEVNTYLSSYRGSIVDEINGVKIRQLKDVKEGLAARNAGKEDFIVIKLLENDRPLVLKRALAEAAHPRIMQTYNISEDAYLGNE